MFDSDDFIDIKSCRICLSTKKPLCPLFKYKLSGNYAEMLTAIADVKVACNDGLPDKICTKCCGSLEKAYLLKTIAERSDRRMRKMLQKIQDSKSKPAKKIAFNSITDIKSEIGPLAVKMEPKWEAEIELLSNENGMNPVDTMQECNDIVIADTVIRKLEGTKEDETKNDFFSDSKMNDNTDWNVNTQIKFDDDDDDIKDPDFVANDFFEDDDDEDYLPEIKPKLKTPKPSKFKKPKLSDIKVFKDNSKKRLVKKIKVLRKSDFLMRHKDFSDVSEDKPGTYITCYPIMRNGTRGPPILLKRPKDATILKVHPNYKPRKASGSSPRQTHESKTAVKRVLRPTAPTVAKQREKMVCPVCGILTHTLGNHMTTHQEKKRYPCSQCTRSFAQKSNLFIHMKQHSGIRDHICEICGAGFYSQKSLIRHNLIHKGERPYSCTLCSKSFIARCDLNRHLRIHSGYKPFKCNTCTMSFNAKHQLQNHERMHTGERPYTCQVCNVAFSYKVNLNNHVQKVHGINLKFKSIHTVTEDILRKEQEMSGETRTAVAHIMPPLTPAPAVGAHETISHQIHYI